MCIKMCSQYATRSLLASYKISNFIVCVKHCMLWLFNSHEDQIFVDIVGLLSMIIYEVLYTQCLRYNFCSAWFLDIRISTCSNSLCLAYNIYDTVMFL